MTLSKMNHFAGCSMILSLAMMNYANANDFTFKRVGLPKPGEQRITIQIEQKPEDQANPAPPAPTSTEATPHSDWFWSKVSPSLKDSSPQTFINALSHLAVTTEITAPRLQDLQNIASQHERAILKTSVGSNLSPALILAIIATESGGDPKAQSRAGAQGLMQLIPATAKRFGVSDPNDPAQNIKGGVTYLSWLLREFNNDPIMMLAGYNAGENAVKKHAGVPPFAETRAYIPKVLNAYRVARGLCKTPPELFSDGCVFINKQELING